MKQVVLLLDETGSMEPHRAETVKAVNHYLADLRAAPEPPLLWLTLFNSMKTEARYAGVPVAEVEGLNAETYQPDNLTPLYDAIMATMESVEGEALMVIVTDGLENASHRYPGMEGRTRVKLAMDEKKEKGWEFLFLASSLDVALEGTHLGIAHATSPTQNIGHAMRTASLASTDYLAGTPMKTAATYAMKTRKDTDASRTWQTGEDGTV